MKVLRWLDKNFEEFILLIFLIVMVVVMGVQVLMRYLFNYSLTWSEELTRYLFVWSSFLSIGYCIKNSTSIKLEQFLGVLPGVLSQVIRLTSKIVMLAFFVFVFMNAVTLVQSTQASGQVSSALGFPIYLVQSSAVVGFALAIFRLLQSFYLGFMELKGAEKQHS
ncbi:TRAP-type C4-dicarboxylate transport system, small permease component [Dethiosulfatibacter aminovorans DSM 17477]|uniref:TRAP-type C4-dicarboxylate transport system, small permease component n=1 Tax=Dethiosulfatibacter aminovorans DSM 17477 TaxID=1121476 RepID=A0A1M6AIZ0_9FIRM|nr:TRAP transporter small permease [Dethiosulfatibacter aminovorans]SHI36442.1 TRAP-type C4-dicarboxylate transport system, small permease component [Dethiosulfatibacter aminovorans DSM 17477]